MSSINAVYFIDDSVSIRLIYQQPCYKHQIKKLLVIVCEKNAHIPSAWNKMQVHLAGRGLFNSKI